MYVPKIMNIVINNDKVKPIFDIQKSPLVSNFKENYVPNPLSNLTINLPASPVKSPLKMNKHSSSFTFDIEAQQFLPDVYEKEVERYLPYLKKHIEIIKPKIILLLGSTAMNAILKNADVISKMRGKWHIIEISNLKICSIVLNFILFFLS